MAEPEMSWARTLADKWEGARKRPAMYWGSETDGALYAAIRMPLRLMWEAGALQDPSRATIAVSPQQYHFRGEAGPLLSELEQLIDWTNYDVLLQALGAVVRELPRWPAGSRRFYHSTFSLSAFADLLEFADRAIIGIRLSTGLLCQSYERGWPVTPPFVVQETGAAVGLVVAAALSTEWQYGLPFTPEAAERFIPEEARPFVELRWRPNDDLVPVCPRDANCVLHPENVGRWL